MCVHAVLCGHARNVTFLEAGSMHHATRGIPDMMTEAYRRSYQPSLASQPEGALAGHIEVGASQAREKSARRL